MPRAKKNRNGVWIVTAAFNYDRRKITLGRIGKADVDCFVANLNLLIDHNKNHGKPPETLRSWLSELSDIHKRQIAELGLLGKSSTYSISELHGDFEKYRLKTSAPSTKVEYLKGKRNLIDKFGDVPIDSIGVRDAREFYHWLLDKGGEGLSENTAKQRLRYARTMFAMAVEDEKISKNPFKARGLSVTQSAAKKDYIEGALIDQLVEYSNDLEWQLLFTMARCIPMRIPSELRELTWSDVDWAKERILIHSPKTRNLGKHARLVPIFPRLKPILNQWFFEVENETHVFPGIRLITNVASIAQDISTRAKVEIWSNYWNALRATAETDLMDRFGIRKACQWSGNSPLTAIKNYSLIRSEEFDDSGENHQQQIFAMQDRFVNNHIAKERSVSR